MRVSNGLNALLYHPKIQEWASVRAQEQTIVFSHIRPDGSNCLTVGQGLCFENLMRSEEYPTRIAIIKEYAFELVTSWYISESHKVNMLSSSANLGAVSCYVRGNNVYIAHLFSMKTLYYMDYFVE